MGMFDKDIVFGGEQLEPNVKDEQEYVLWECGIVAENVVTELGTDGVKAEVVISQVTGTTGKARGNHPQSTVPAKFGTFASSIVGKVRQKGDGDLPAVVKFHKVPAKNTAHNDAFVMSFVRPWTGDPAGDIPALSPYVDMKGEGEPVDTEPVKSTVRVLTDAEKDAQFGETMPS